MSNCLCLACDRANPLTTKFCTQCGAKLQIQERYRALKVIGQGGFGKTFLAQDESKPSQPRCVVKQFAFETINPNASQGTLDVAIRLFEQEAKRLDDLGKHPQIPELLSFTIHEGKQYLIQEFIDGETLEQELARVGAFSEQQVRDALVEVLQILEFVHSKSVIHRDISPDNIIRRRSNQKLVLVDFGAAKHATATLLAKTGTGIGKPSYGAPEQMLGKSVFQSDLFGLGVTCLHLLTNVEPFTLYDVFENEYQWRQFLNGKVVSDRFGKLLDRMTASKAKDRPNSVTETLQVLQTKASPVKPAPLPVVPSQQSWSLLTRVIVTFPFCMILAVFLWQTFNNQKNQETEFQQAIESAKRAQVNLKNQKIELRQAIEARTVELVNLFVGNLPVSVIIDDIRKRTPLTVQVESITQAPIPPSPQNPNLTSSITLTGKATSYNELNDFLLLLKASPLLEDKETKLVSSSLQQVTADKNFTLVNFQVKTAVTTKNPAEILPDLQKIGADGLATRINLLWQQGLIPIGQVASKSNIAEKIKKTNQGNIEEANRMNIFVLSLLPPVDNIDTLIRDIQEQIPKTIVIALPPNFSYELVGTLRTFQPKERVESPSKQYYLYSFTIGFDGKFEDVLTTIQKIERLKPLLAVKDLKLTKKALPITNFKFSVPITSDKEKDILNNLPPLFGADFTLQVFVPKTLEEIKATAIPPPKNNGSH